MDDNKAAGATNENKQQQQQAPQAAAADAYDELPTAEMMARISAEHARVARAAELSRKAAACIKEIKYGLDTGGKDCILQR